MERSNSDAATLELWVVRHGQTVDNVKNYCQGHLDGKLTEVGVAQAKILGQRLATTSFDRCYVSDLGRTRETFDAIVSQWKTFDRENASIVFSPLMREKAGGVAEGGPLSVIHDAQKKSGLPVRDFKPQKGECWKDVYARASRLMRQVFFECLVQRTGQGRIELCSAPVSARDARWLDHGAAELHPLQRDRPGAFGQEQLQELRPQRHRDADAPFADG